mmetsp:Transcript_22835/g.56731  ORF Transcript_22835/g.56731 Transcript_22835/m.56731 type:complete len:211 (-) Transcript_22835:465-1097(-)
MKSFIGQKSWISSFPWAKKVTLFRSRVDWPSEHRVEATVLTKCNRHMGTFKWLSPSPTQREHPPQARTVHADTPPSPTHTSLDPPSAAQTSSPSAPTPRHRPPHPPTTPPPPRHLHPPQRFLPVLVQTTARQQAPPTCAIRAFPPPQTPTLLSPQRRARPTVPDTPTGHTRRRASATRPGEGCPRGRSREQGGGSGGARGGRGRRRVGMR